MNTRVEAGKNNVNRYCATTCDRTCFRERCDGLRYVAREEIFIVTALIGPRQRNAIPLPEDAPPFHPSSSGTSKPTTMLGLLMRWITPPRRRHDPLRRVPWRVVVRAEMPVKGNRTGDSYKCATIPPSPFGGHSFKLRHSPRPWRCLQAPSSSARMR